MGRICDRIFAVILVFFLAKGTSSTEGKARHWLFVFIDIFRRFYRRNISGSDDRNPIFDLDVTKMVSLFAFPYPKIKSLLVFLVTSYAQYY